MITCFPANNSTDAHHCDIRLSRSSPSHFTKDSPFNTSQVRTRSTTKKLNHCLENQKGYYLRNRNTGNAHAAIHLRTINQFLKLVYLTYVNSQYTFYISFNLSYVSQDRTRSILNNSGHSLKNCKLQDLVRGLMIQLSQLM